MFVYTIQPVVKRFEDRFESNGCIVYTNIYPIVKPV